MNKKFDQEANNVDWAYNAAHRILNKMDIFKTPRKVHDLSAELRSIYRRGHKAGWKARSNLKADMGY
jgi:hypothetical protein